MSTILPPKPKKSLFTRLRNIGILIGVILLYIWTFQGISVDFPKAFERMINNYNRIIPKLFNPDWAVFGKVWEAMVETIYIAFVGSLTAAILAIPLGFLAAQNMTKNRVVTTVGKWILSAIRAFPDIILAILFIVVVGPKPFAGVLAIAIGSTGMLGKLYSEVLESIDTNIIEAMEATGANKLQILAHGILPQITPEFLSYALYRFEIDIRASTILGIVGAGGIGTLIIFAKMNRNWEEMGLILLVIIVVVTFIDIVSTKIRKRLV
ncbi:alkylphosphonate ABC transporter permease [Bacillus coahuilensis m2-6]|uniref:phosphonate ABC transporter, permease protein PhnE n=1 Tax=Bacillus coahuilensis TaxID=408580 RepID=UPI0007505C90|nr:phosphonate ABC transporter, permease protein PhnE [Bacillus coahuilensis]KUP05397.1 alkylphosphonate ABC transporter permease [Bacillus coahuilensis m2-6]